VDEIGGPERHPREARLLRQASPDDTLGELPAGDHRTHFYAHYANRVRGQRPGEEEPRHTAEAEPTTRRRSSPSWARLIAKVFQADPLVCRRCGRPLKVAAYITDLDLRRPFSYNLRGLPPR
jgi:hypothetical protein